jgi:hypothetical protein
MIRCDSGRSRIMARNESFYTHLMPLASLLVKSTCREEGLPIVLESGLEYFIHGLIIFHIRAMAIS